MISDLPPVNLPGLILAVARLLRRADLVIVLSPSLDDDGRLTSPL